MLHAAPRGGGPPPPAVAPQHLQLGQELDTLTAGGFAGTAALFLRVTGRRRQSADLLPALLPSAHVQQAARPLPVPPLPPTRCCLLAHLRLLRTCSPPPVPVPETPYRTCSGGSPGQRRSRGEPHQPRHGGAHAGPPAERARRGGAHAGRAAGRWGRAGPTRHHLRGLGHRDSELPCVAPGSTQGGASARLLLHSPQPPHHRPQAFAAAETAYARAMTAVARLSLVGGSDGASLRAAMEQVSELPSLMGLSHSSVGGWVWPSPCMHSLPAVQ